MKAVLFVIHFFRMKIEAVFQHVKKQLSLRQAEKRATRWNLIQNNG
jgi:hypothetical protein